MRLLVAVCLSAALTGCSDFSEGFQEGVQDGASEKPKGQVSRSELGEEWPLTVDEGVLACDGKDGTGSATFTSGGTKYALNGLAKGKGDGIDIDPIWAPNPEVSGLKKDISPLIDRALALCE